MTKISDKNIFTSTWSYDKAPESTDHVKIEDQYELFINGKFIKPVEGKYFNTINPATNKVISKIAEASSSDVDKAVISAQNGFKKWSALSGKEKGLVSGFFNDYKQDFMVHISHEEKEILPYILELEKQAHGKKSEGGQIKQLKHYPITEFANEHDRLEYSLENLSKLIIKYLPPFNDQDLCVQVLQDLAELVKDLADHADMEDKVLIPRVAELEQRLILNSGAS